MCKLSFSVGWFVGLFVFYGEYFLLSDIKTSFRGVQEGNVEDPGASRGSEFFFVYRMIQCYAQT